MTLPFLAQQFQNVNFELRGFGPRHLVRCGRACERPAHSQFSSTLDGEDVRDRRIPIENRKGLTALNTAKELA